MAKTRRAAVDQLSPGRTRSGRLALKEKTNTSRFRVPLYEDDGNTEQLVKDAKSRPGQRRKIIQPELNLVMTGGLGLGASSSEGSDSLVLPTATAMAGEHGMDSATAQTIIKPDRKRRVPRRIVSQKSQQEVFAGMKRRMKDTAQIERSQHPTDNPGSTHAVDTRDILTRTTGPATAASISPSPPRLGRSSLPHVPRSSIMPPGSALKVYGTPAMESSLLALRNFKRRPRQPSMLQMVQQRTASARPSAVHAPMDEESSDLDFDLDDIGGGDDFAPDAEGTPVKARNPESTSFHKSRTSPSEIGVATGNSTKGSERKRKSDETGSASALLRSRHKKRQRSSTPAVLQSFVTAPEKSVSPDDSVLNDIRMSPIDPATNVEVIHSSPPSSPPLDSMSPIQQAGLSTSNVLIASSWQSDKKGTVVRKDIDQGEPGIDADSTFADPASSSPVLGPRLDNNEAEELNEPMTQLSPKPKRSKSRKAAEKTLSTAQLQTLLPRRRRRLETRQLKPNYDLDFGSDAESSLDSSNLNDDEDELNATLPSRRGDSNMAKKSQSSKPSRATRKIRTTPKRGSAIKPPRKRINRTYGKKSISDKENDDAYETRLEDTEQSTLPDISLTMHEVSKGNELEEAKRKFAEVDGWDMEFESFSAEDHRSSSFGWR